MADKRLTEDEAIGELSSGMTVAIGGWGSRRKPMSLVRALLRSDLDDLTIVSHGGPDVGLLCAAGKVRKVVYAFVALDVVTPTNDHTPVLEPHFRKARQAGLVEDEPLDEGLFHLGLQAAAWRVPFLPTRVGLGSDLLHHNATLRTVRSPFEDSEELVAMPALQLDAALCHLNRSDARGNSSFLGPDLYWDDLMLQATPTGRRFVSTERIVPTEQLASEANLQQLRISRMMVDGVIEAAGGAHFTACVPDYPRDEAFQQEYVAAAKSDEAWQNFRTAWLDLPEADYQRKRTELQGAPA
jgi:glutaconate CoA-transferase subunit A